MIADDELARRSLLGYGETLVAFARGAAGGAAVRRADAVGARLPGAAGSPWLDAVVVPWGAAPPAADDPELPTCVWTVHDAVARRVEDPAIRMPCLGVELASFAGDAAPVAAPSLAALGALNEDAYGDHGVLGPALAALDDPRARTHGLLAEDGTLVCACLTLRIDGDVSVQYVATDPAHQRRGLASALLRAVLGAARDEGLESATLQASPDGLPVYERLGFRTVTALRAFRRA